MINWDKIDFSKAMGKKSGHVMPSKDEMIVSPTSISFHAEHRKLFGDSVHVFEDRGMIIVVDGPTNGFAIQPRGNKKTDRNNAKAFMVNCKSRLKELAIVPGTYKIMSNRDKKAIAAEAKFRELSSEEQIARSLNSSASA